MGPEIVIPVVLLAVVVPIGLMWARKSFKEGISDGSGEPVSAPTGRLTSEALRALPAPPWRVVYEIADEKLGGVGHVLIGPPGVFALHTSMEPLPEPPAGEPDPHDLARVAIARGDLDDALSRCALSSDALVTVHWGVNATERGPSVGVTPGHTAVDGRRLGEWVESLAGAPLSAAQVDLAWQTVLTAIGRPDPLS